MKREFEQYGYMLSWYRYLGTVARAGVQRLAEPTGGPSHTRRMRKNRAFMGSCTCLAHKELSLSLYITYITGSDRILYRPSKRGPE